MCLALVLNLRGLSSCNFPGDFSVSDNLKEAPL